MYTPRHTAFPIVLALALILLTPALLAGDWAKWRGPNQNGSASAGGVIDKEGYGLEILWRKPIGSAYSGISVLGDRLVTMDSDGESDLLVAMDSGSGAELWRYEIEPMYKGHDGSDDGPISTPIIDDGMVYGLGASGKLFAVRLKDGSEVWSSNIQEKFDAHVPVYGFTTQPVAYGDTLFVQTGGSEGRSLTAFDKKTGKVRWSSGDDAVGYQSPVIATLAGRSQVLALGNKVVAGYAPETGDVLWSQEYDAGENDGSAQPVLLGASRFLLVRNADSVVYEVTESDGAFSVDEVWTSDAINGSLATPVVYEGHLYGFDGNFLTCVEAAGGTKIWKSRPPGGNGLILVDDYLVIYDAKGRIVLAPASPEGYEEKASLEISERGTYTYPSFADGSIFVRNLTEMFRIGITDTPTIVEEEKKHPPAESAFGRFALAVEASDNKRAMIDDFMNSQKGFPVVEGDDQVHFIYRGAAEDVAITGNMTHWFVEEPMERIAGTDLFFKTYRFRPGVRLEYRFNVDFDNLVPDPLNPRRVPGNFGDMSELALPGWSAPDHVKAYRGSRPGSLDTFTLNSEILGNEREITVYLPPGYADSKDRYPLLLVNEGEEWLQFGNMPNSLNNLIGSEVRPVIVAFVNSLGFAVSQGELGGAGRADYARMLVEELVPRIDAEYRTIAEREARAVMGYAMGAFAALNAGLQHPDVFGHVGMQSIYLQPPVVDELMDRLAQAPTPGPRFHLDWYLYDLHNPNFNIDLRADSTKVADAIRKSGCELSGREIVEGAGWGAWRAHAGDMLRAFFPMK